MTEDITRTVYSRHSGRLLVYPSGDPSICDGKSPETHLINIGRQITGTVCIQLALIGPEVTQPLSLLSAHVLHSSLNDGTRRTRAQELKMNGTHKFLSKSLVTSSPSDLLWRNGVNRNYEPSPFLDVLPPLHLFVLFCGSPAAWQRNIRRFVFSSFLLLIHLSCHGCCHWLHNTTHNQMERLTRSAMPPDCWCAYPWREGPRIK